MGRCLHPHYSRWGESHLWSLTLQWLWTPLSQEESNVKWQTHMHLKVQRIRDSRCTSPILKTNPKALQCCVFGVKQGALRVRMLWGLFHVLIQWPSVEANCVECSLQVCTLTHLLRTYFDIKCSTWSCKFLTHWLWCRHFTLLGNVVSFANYLLGLFLPKEDSKGICDAHRSRRLLWPGCLLHGWPGGQSSELLIKDDKGAKPYSKLRFCSTMLI